jgi:hypothetical protein
VEIASDDAALRYVGAGPLKDFVIDDEPRLLWIESQASTSDRFRTALSNVWVWDCLTAEQFERVERGARPARPAQDVTTGQATERAELPH